MSASPEAPLSPAIANNSSSKSTAFKGKRGRKEVEKREKRKRKDQEGIKIPPAAEVVAGVEKTGVAICALTGSFFAAEQTRVSNREGGEGEK
jgi:hypothetical protein